MMMLPWTYPALPHGIQAYTNGLWTNLRGDPTFSALVTLDPAHHELHEGEHFTYADFVDLGNGASHNLLLVTPNSTKRIHLIWAAECEAEATITLFEDTVTSNNGTAVQAYNNRRDSSNTPDLVVTHTPTITGDGTQLIRQKVGSGKQSGGKNRGDSEWILDQNSKYMLRITNDTTSNNWASWSLSWYEHTDDA